MERWDPQKDISSLRERINKIFEDALEIDSEIEYPVWIPVVDMYETPEMFVVKAELPEVKEQDIHISAEGNTLRIKGERRLQREGRSYYQVERAYGTFSRSFVLSTNVDRDKIKATLKDGILTIKIPKKEIDLPKHVEIT